MAMDIGGLGSALVALYVVGVAILRELRRRQIRRMSKECSGGHLRLVPGFC